MIGNAPTFDGNSAAALAREHFGLHASATPLTSERDQNFLLAVADGRRAILKIANAAEDHNVLSAQQAAMDYVAREVSITPRIVRTTSGAPSATVQDANGRDHVAWVVTLVPGFALGDVPYRTPGLWRHFGETVAELTNALVGFDHDALHRTFHWDLARGRDVVDAYRSLIIDASHGAVIDTLIERFDRHTQPLLALLPRSVVHGDLNDYNVLVGGGMELFDRNQRVTGVIDFGDMIHSYTVGDLAIAAAYAMLDAPDPLSVLCDMVRGYHHVRPLREPEMAAVWGLSVLRLCVSAVLAAQQQRERPDNPYLSVSQQAIARTLPRLAQIPFAFAAATVRGACGREPIGSSDRVRDWLTTHAASFAPVLGVDLRTEPAIVLDLSIGSPLLSGDTEHNAEPALTDRVFRTMRAANVHVAIGRYDEPRLLYITPAFAAGGGTLSEQRTVHIGLDLFAVAGTPVFAPFDGVVHAADAHEQDLDYGGVIVLRHDVHDDLTFYTLYGHLSFASFGSLRVGDRVVRGQQMATLGTPAENGNWTPHLHLQIITDLLDLGSDFPGVGTASRRDVWRSVSPDPNLIVGAPSTIFPRAPHSQREALRRRGAMVGPSVRIAYRDPVRIVRGWRQYLFSDDGRRYLDAYNNVPHVGHAHPRVVAAAAQQMSVLNTNTRYLHDGLDAYAERLTDLLPDSLRVCYLLSSASEANELALRLARTYTEHTDMVVLEAAYHGNTGTLVDMSPYKHAGPGGRGAPDWVHVAPLADDYRGAYKRGDRDAGRKYANDLATVIDEATARGRRIAGFIAESCPSVGGQIMFPDGYLAAAYAHVRRAGGVCIADEVQTGLGRIGSHYWGFESQHVIPDIVVMGKPLGNGHPLAAVVTTRQIADAFDNGMEFFSTFGGNTVSCAVGTAVLDVMRDEGLQLQAHDVGERLLAGLRRMMTRHALIGDVRGSGLFLGVELVRDRETLTPAADAASYVSNRMRDEGILLGTDGPHHNVVKIRPPMPFDTANADQLLETMDRVLGELA